jgi:hypothetical protein
MATLREYMNSKLKAMGKSAAQAKKSAGKYKSIAAAKKAGSLYYTDKNGKVMAAVYAEDLKKPISSAPKKSTKPKAKPPSPGSKRPPKRPLGSPPLRERNPIKTETLLPGSDKTLEDVLKDSDKKSPSRGPSKRPRRSPSSLTPNEKKLRDWRAGEKNLSMKEQGRLRKWALRNNKSVPKDLYSTPDNYK